MPQLPYDQIPGCVRVPISFSEIHQIPWMVSRQPQLRSFIIETIEPISEVIRLSVAPVFLLAGIAGMLNVVSLRLGRIVDRARILESRLAVEKHSGHREKLQLESEALWKRIRLVNWSLRMFVAGALLVCLVIMTLFLGQLRFLDLSSIIASLFIGAMNLLILGLILFLVEVSISSQRIRKGITQILLNEEEDSDAGK